MSDDDASGDITRLLADVANGDEDARNVLIATIYNDLHGKAAMLMCGERTDHTLDATALVHEALLRLIKPQQLAVLTNRRMVFAAAARAMRQVLIDGAKKKRYKRGLNQFPLHDAVETAKSMGIDLDSLQQAMADLERVRQRAFHVVDLRFFAGLKIGEISALLEVSDSTVEKDLAWARTFLRKRLLA